MILGNNFQGVTEQFKKLNRGGVNIGDVVNNVNEAKEKGKTELEHQFPKTTTVPQDCRSRKTMVTVNGQNYTVVGTPNYIRTTQKKDNGEQYELYTLQSIEYKVVPANTNVDTNDYDKNIHNPTAKADINPAEMLHNAKQELKMLHNSISYKCKQLSQLYQSISGTERSSKVPSGMDFEDSDDIATVQKNIQEAEKFAKELDEKIEAARKEFDEKTNQVNNLSNESGKLNADFKAAMQQLKDMGYDTSELNLKELESIDRKSPLDALINHYNLYISMMKENLQIVYDKIDEIRSLPDKENNPEPIEEPKGPLTKFGEPLSVDHGEILKKVNDLLKRIKS